MRRIIRPSILILILAMFILPSCRGGDEHPFPLTEPPAIERTGEISVTDVAMTTSVDNESKPTGGIKSSFSADAPAIYCSFKLTNVIPEDSIKATWLYVGGDVPNAEKMIISEMYDIVSFDPPIEKETPVLGKTPTTFNGSYYLAFYNEKPVEGWKKGNYEVVLSVNNMDKATISFSIK